MSAVIEGAVKALQGKISSFDGSAKFVVEGEGAIMIDESGVRAGDEENEAIQKLNEIAHDDSVRTFIEETWPKGEVIPAF